MVIIRVIGGRGGFLPANVVLNDQINTYVAGFKQNFSPNASFAGLNVGSFFGIPSTLANGDIWYDTDFEQFRCREFGITSLIATAEKNNFFSEKQTFDGNGTSANIQLSFVNPTGGVASGDVWRESPQDLQYRAAGGITSRIILEYRENTYFAGAKQSFTHNATTAGLRIVPAVGNPSVRVSGDIWINSGASNIIQYAVGAAIRNLVELSLAQTITTKTMDYNSNTFQNVPLMQLGWINPAPIAVAKSTTSLHAIVGIGDPSGTEAEIEWYAPVAGTVTQLRTFVPASSNHTANCAITVRRNGGNTLLATLYASGVTGLLTDLVNTFTVVAGDRISIGIQNTSVGGGNRDFDVSMVGLMIES